MVEKLILVDGGGTPLKEGDMVHGHCEHGTCLPEVPLLALYPSLRRVLVAIDGGRVCLDAMQVGCVFVTPEEQAELQAKAQPGGKHPWKH